jgi:hypothetical protein
VRGSSRRAFLNGRAVGANYLVRGHDLKVTLDWSRIDRYDIRATQVVTVQVQMGM